MYMAHTPWHAPLQNGAFKHFRKRFAGEAQNVLILEMSCIMGEVISLWTGEGRSGNFGKKNEVSGQYNNINRWTKLSSLVFLISFKYCKLLHFQYCISNLLLHIIIGSLRSLFWKMIPVLAKLVVAWCTCAN